MDKIHVYVDEDNYVKEFINAKREGFIETDLTYLDIPKNFTEGYYKYEDGKVSYDEEKKKELYGSVEVTADEFHEKMKELDEAKADNAKLKVALAELAEALIGRDE